MLEKKEIWCGTVQEVDMGLQNELYEKEWKFSDKKCSFKEQILTRTNDFLKLWWLEKNETDDYVYNIKFVYIEEQIEEQQLL